MGANDNERIRKEAADAVTSRPPGPSGNQVDEAIRRYLGSEMYHVLGHEPSKQHRNDDRPVAGGEGRPS
jgi:hypothetical protein